MEVIQISRAGRDPGVKKKKKQEEKKRGSHTHTHTHTHTQSTAQQAQQSRAALIQIGARRAVDFCFCARFTSLLFSFSNLDQLGSRELHFGFEFEGAFTKKEKEKSLLLFSRAFGISLTVDTSRRAGVTQRKVRPGSFPFDAGARRRQLGGENLSVFFLI